MNFQRIIVGSLESNCYILNADVESIIIDPGAEADKILQTIDQKHISLILMTHRHYDHTDALAEIKAATDAKAAIHRDDWFDQCDIKLADNQVIPLGNEEITVLHTPGHTPGGCCYLINKDLFSGDTLFPGGHGNTSFPGGDEKAIYISIRAKLMPLSDDTRVHPGHGPSTTIGRERSLY